MISISHLSISLDQESGASCIHFVAGRKSAIKVGESLGRNPSIMRTMMPCCCSSWRRSHAFKQRPGGWRPGDACARPCRVLRRRTVLLSSSLLSASVATRHPAYSRVQHSSRAAHSSSRRFRVRWSRFLKQNVSEHPRRDCVFLGSCFASQTLPPWSPLWYHNVTPSGSNKFYPHFTV